MVSPDSPRFRDINDALKAGYEGHPDSPHGILKTLTRDYLKWYPDEGEMYKEAEMVFSAEKDDFILEKALKE